MKYLLGIDLGSSSVKVTVIADNGSFIADASCEYQTYYPNVGWAEQKPNEWYRATISALQELIKYNAFDLKNLEAISLDAATHTAVLLDSDLQPLADAIFWTDQRSAAQASWLNENMHDVLQKTAYNTASSVWTLPQLMWLKENQPEQIEKTRQLLFAKDYLRYRLTNDLGTDRIDAMGSMFYDVDQRCWSTKLCELAGIAKTSLPEVRGPLDIGGYISNVASKATGLPEGIPVFTGMPDTAMELVASGVINTGQSAIKLATAGRLYNISREPILNPFLINYQYVIDGTWYPGAATKSSAASLRWFRDAFFGSENAFSGGSIYQKLDEAASKIAPGSEGLLFHPYLTGELTPFNDERLRASFVGVTMRHTKAHFIRSILEGVAFSLKDCMGIMADAGVAPASARVIGGGAKSDLWRTILSDVLGISLHKPKHDDSSFGSAMIAGVGSGAFKSIERAVEVCVKIESVTKPDEKQRIIYDANYVRYKRVIDILMPLYQDTNDLYYEKSL